MKNIFPGKKTFLLVCFPGIFVFSVNAQKLPAIQKASVYAPDNIKIDGKTTEWNDKFLAYHPVNRIFYTIANNDDNLYLTIVTNDEQSFNKVIVGGIIFTLQPLTAKVEGQLQKKIVISYPTLVKQYKGMVRDNDHENRRFVKTNDTTTGIVKTRLDSLTSAVSEKVNGFFKEIGVEGITCIQDSLIAIYNTENIKVALRYNSKLQLVYELALPLKYFGTVITNARKFKYDIRLNGLPQEGQPIFEDPYKSLGPEGLFLARPTNFGGSYTLAKKN
jgi:hypothetical protein